MTAGFSEGELAYTATRTRPGQHLAARFCAARAAELDVNVRVSLTHTRRDAAAVAILV